MQVWRETSILTLRRIQPAPEPLPEASRKALQSGQLGESGVILAPVLHRVQDLSHRDIACSARKLHDPVTGCKAAFTQHAEVEPL